MNVSIFAVCKYSSLHLWHLNFVQKLSCDNCDCANGCFTQMVYFFPKHVRLYISDKRHLAWITSMVNVVSMLKK